MRAPATTAAAAAAVRRPRASLTTTKPKTTTKTPTALFLLATALLAAAALPRASAVPAFTPAVWNAYTRYEAAGVKPEQLFGDSSNGAKLFPLGFGASVEAECAGPGHPFASPAAAHAPGACEYAPAAPGSTTTYTFWQKLKGERLRLSNCYCYALDVFKGGWCQPGLGGGAGDITPAEMNCAALTARVLADGARRAPRAEAVEGPPAPAGAPGAHFIALWARPQASCGGAGGAGCGPDYHFARRDASGAWSHKVGEGPATDRDSAGHLITDPEAAAIGGGYTEFCGYFEADARRMRVGAERQPDRTRNLLAQWRAAGIDVKEVPLPYDAATDFVDEAARAKERLAMQRLQQGGAAPAAPNKERAEVRQQQQQQGSSGSGGNGAQMLRGAPAAPADAPQAAARQGGARRLLVPRARSA